MERATAVIDRQAYAVTSVGVDVHLNACAKLTELAGVKKRVLYSDTFVIKVMEKERRRYLFVLSGLKAHSVRKVNVVLSEK